MKHEKVSRREFLSFALAAASFLVFELTPAGPLKPALAEICQKERGKFSGDIYFSQMHSELLEKKMEERITPGGRVDEGDDIDILIVGGGIAGLDTAYYLLTNPDIRKHGASVRLFEMDDEPGGTSKEYEWEGIPYTNSAAYIYLGEENHPDARLYKELGILDESSVPDERAKESVIIGNKIHGNVFREGRGNEKETRALRKGVDFFLFIAAELYPDVPFNPGGAYSREEFLRLDNLSFGDLLEKGAPLKGETVFPAPMPALIRECAENYCYSALGCSSYEVSAWQGLNWFAPEFTDKGVAVLPGGNGRITTRLREKIEKLDRDCLRMSMPVVDVEHDPRSGKNIVTVALRKGEKTSSYKTFRAKYIVVSTPFHVIKHILHSELAKEMRSAIDRFNYSAYIVGNVMINGSCFSDYWDMYCLDEYHLYGRAGEDHYRNKAFMDIINASWVLKKKGLKKGGKEKTVISVYSPQPFPGQRQELMSDDYCEKMKNGIRSRILSILLPQGIKESDIADIRIARWGHAMFLANPGILSSGILEKFEASLDKKNIFFAGTALLGSPTIENCHYTARKAVYKLTEALSGKSGRK